MSSEPLASGEAASTPGAAIEVIDIAVKYRVPTQRILSFKEYILHRIVRGMDYRDLWALDGVSFSVAPGEVFGIVGRNGAGKSTLLKVISRVLRPTRGRLVLRGSVAPLLELGAGFHPDLTGKENVFLNATILGYPRSEIRERLHEIVEFAELQEFIDAPIRTYSSGMVARLGFSVATLTRPDILALDEVLSVGDVGFQEKCLKRIREFSAQGTTILLVSHSLDTVKSFCSRAAWLEHGRIAAAGDPARVVEAFRGAMQVSP